jgi:hypothetical protein
MQFSSFALISHIMEERYMRIFSTFLIWIPFLIICGATSAIAEETETWNPSSLAGNTLRTGAQYGGPYLGQQPPGMIPEKFGPDFVSSAGASEYSICFSPDSTEIYFSRMTPNVSNTIWWTKQRNGVWSTPVLPPFTGSYYNSEPFITTDNSKIYFVSVRDTTTVFRIWYCSRVDTGWGVPQMASVPFPDKPRMFPTMSSAGNLYFSQLDQDGRFYFYSSRNNNGVFETPVKLSTVVNAFFIHAHIFIAPDESYIVFDAIPTQQSTGSSIYVSFRNKDSSWATPIKLGSAINATSNQYCAEISPDGKYLFFTKNEDLWWVDAKVVTDLKPAVNVDAPGGEESMQFRLYQNSPNPFNPATTIEYSLEQRSFVTISIMDLLGQEVTVLTREEKPAGRYSVTWNATHRASGSYFCKLQAGAGLQIRKMLLMK